MRHLIVGTVLGVTGMLAACGFAEDQHLVGPYRLVATDTTEQMSLMYSLGDDVVIACVEDTVFAVGWNERHIVAKQHPKNDRAVTNYFYLDMKAESKPCAGVTGPLTAPEFESARAAQGLPAFDLVISALQ
jgi:hypothetical protein